MTIVVPFPSGGGTDAFARPLTAVLTKNLGKQIIIDNRGGAGGTVGATIASKAAPDGYTFFMGAVHHTIAPSIPTATDSPGRFCSDRLARAICRPCSASTLATT